MYVCIFKKCGSTKDFLSCVYTIKGTVCTSVRIATDAVSNIQVLASNTRKRLDQIGSSFGLGTK